MLTSAPKTPVKIIPRQGSVGLVIGTFAALPYLHLALEMRQRLYPGTPLLVSDDGSPNREELHELCRRYGAEFISNPKRLAKSLGDLSVYVHGLEWAARRKLNLLVKMSRRFIPLHNWLPPFRQLAFRTQYATYSKHCREYGLEFRTECVGFHVRSWCESDALTNMKAVIAQGKTVYVEGYLHSLAREIHQSQGQENPEYEMRSLKKRTPRSYGIWDIMAERRTERKSGVLWHDCNSPLEYHQTALQTGLSYPFEAFIDANQGFGATRN